MGGTAVLRSRNTERVPSLDCGYERDGHCIGFYLLGVRPRLTLRVIAITMIEITRMAPLVIVLMIACLGCGLGMMLTTLEC